MLNHKRELMRLLKCSNLLVIPKEYNKNETSCSWLFDRSRIFPQNSRVTVKNLLSTIETTTKYLEDTGCYNKVQITLNSNQRENSKEDSVGLNFNDTLPEITIVKSLNKKNRLFGSINLSIGKQMFIEVDAGVRNMFSQLETFQSKLKIGNSVELENKLKIPYKYNFQRNSPNYEINTIYGNFSLNNKFSKDKYTNGMGISLKDIHTLNFSTSRHGIHGDCRYGFNYRFQIPLYNKSGDEIKYTLENNILNQEDRRDGWEDDRLKFNYNKNLFSVNIDCKSTLDKYFVDYKFKRLLIDQVFFDKSTYYDFASYLKLSIRRKTIFDDLSLFKDKTIKFSLNNKASWNIENIFMNVGNILKKFYIKNINTILFRNHKKEFDVVIKGGIKTKFGDTGFNFNILNWLKKGSCQSCFTWKYNK